MTEIFTKMMERENSFRQKNLSGLLNLIGENARIGVLPFHSLGKIEKSHHFLVH